MPKTLHTLLFIQPDLHYTIKTLFGFGRFGDFCPKMAVLLVSSARAGRMFGPVPCTRPVGWLSVACMGVCEVGRRVYAVKLG